MTISARRLVLILHGKASTNEAVRDAVAACREMGHQIDVNTTQRPGDAEHYALQAVRKAHEGMIDTIVAGGGDGTLNAVVAGALSCDEAPPCSFALLPLGTANDFAHTVEIPLNDPLAALEMALHAPARALDIARCLIDDETRARRFVNMMTAGFGPRITSQTDPQLKVALGGAAYLVSALGRIGEVTPWRGQIGGADFAWSGSFLALAIGNGRRAGGGIELCPIAELDDGQLDITVIEAPQGDALSGLLASLPLAIGAETENVVRARADHFTVEMNDPVPVSLDGETLEAHRLDLSIQRHAIRFHLADDRGAADAFQQVDGKRAPADTTTLDAHAGRTIMTSDAHLPPKRA